MREKRRWLTSGNRESRRQFLDAAGMHLLGSSSELDALTLQRSFLRSFEPFFKDASLFTTLDEFLERNIQANEP